MSKKFKSQASSARAASTFGGGFGSFQTSSSPLSYVTESPDLSQISEPNIVVALKNLGKRDSTTKAKALEELQESCADGIEDAVLVAWSDIYPRTSIDNSRRVRQLSHTLQGNFTVYSGKRIAPLLPKVVGSWLAGIYDSDKSVSRTAQDALEKSFPTPDKRKALWKIYRDSLFAYVEDAITVQTKATLSDERTTSPDDAQAKYVRVVGTAMHMLGQMLREGVGHSLLTEKLWQFAYNDEPYLRRGVCGLVTDVQNPDWGVLSVCFLSKGLHTSQAGSSRQYVQALLELTKRRPEIWTTDYTAKTAVSKRLYQFLRQGSQIEPEDVWTNIGHLLRRIPESALFDKPESVGSLAEALKTGAVSNRVSTYAAWTLYVQSCLWLSERCEDRGTFLEQHLLPIVTQYVSKKGEIWSSNPRVSQAVIAGVAQQDQTIFEKAWNELNGLLIDEMRLSLPQSSKEFDTSQHAVIAQAQRLFRLRPNSAETRSFLQASDVKLLEASLELLKSRNGKPFGAAGVAELVVQQPSTDKKSATLRHFFEHDLPGIIDSPSAEKLASLSLLCAYDGIVDILLRHRSTYSENALYEYISKTDGLKDNIQAKIQDRVTDMQDSSSQKLRVSIMKNPALHDLHGTITKQLEQFLSHGSLDTQISAMNFLEDLLAESASANVLRSDEYRSAFLSHLLLLSDTLNDASEQATRLITKLNSSTGLDTGTIPIIQQQLEGSGKALSVFTLIDLANNVLQDPKADPNAVVPTSKQWSMALAPHMSSPRPYSLVVTSPLQGALYMVETSPGQEQQRTTVTDSEGLSLLLRLVMYTTKLTIDMSKLNQASLNGLYASLPLALQIVNEKLTIDNANELWSQTTPEIIQESIDTLSEGNRLVLSWLEQEKFVELWLPKAHEMRDQSLNTYCTALTWTSIITEYVDRSGPSKLWQEYDQDLKNLHRSSHPTQACAILACLRDNLPSSVYGKKICNELVASATDMKSTTPIILLNILLQGQSEALETIPTQRLVFLLKSLVRSNMEAEAMKLLAAILPLVTDIYGEHWEQMLAHLITIWNNQLEITVLNASIRLYARLKSLLVAEDPNEDLLEAWNSARSSLESGLLNCLDSFSQHTQEPDQPRTVTAELLGRQLKDVDVNTDIDIFRLVSSSVEAVQTAAYDVMHRAIPKQQEQASLDLVLEQRLVSLPSNLLTLLDDSSNSRQYLLAWKLVFDHFPKASFKLREAYTGELKQGRHLEGLLMYVCDEVRITGRPIDASKFDIKDFTVGSEKELQWLTIHNYYNSLLYLPSLVKDWFISQKNRVKSPLESWTQKYISPTIIAASLSSVDEWAVTQKEDDRPLVIKTSPRGSELVASIVIDPENKPISLTVILPGSYPLESPAVTSRTRVGVSEKNWQSWLRTFQIIIFSTGNIIEGLIAFRRNVQGALKGQNECAICYSIIGTDMQTPNKKCGTCKNTFHGSCLFRWFKSSNSSSCPLCRNNFNYA